jgi:hypothetical protein
MGDSSTQPHFTLFLHDPFQFRDPYYVQKRNGIALSSLDGKNEVCSSRNDSRLSGKFSQFH